MFSRSIIYLSFATLNKADFVREIYLIQTMAGRGLPHTNFKEIIVRAHPGSGKEV